MRPVRSRKLRTLNLRFKQFGEVEPQEVEYVIDANGNTEVKQVKRFRVPSTLEPLMEKTNTAWRYYSKKFMRNPAINRLVSKLSRAGDIEQAGHLKLLLDLKEQMGEYKKKRDLDGMVQTMRTMYAMLQYMGYDKGPHRDDEYTDINMKLNAENLLKKYGIKKPGDSKMRQMEDFWFAPPRRVMPTLMVPKDMVGVSPMIPPDPQYLNKIRELQKVIVPPVLDETGYLVSHETAGTKPLKQELDHPSVPAINLEDHTETDQKE